VKYEMTDLEITKLCAEAMELPHKIATDRQNGDFVEIIKQSNPGNGGEFDPLHDDAQAMALLKSFWLAVRVDLMGGVSGGIKTWIVADGCEAQGVSTNLNHAIATCIAQMQLTKQKEAA